MRWIHELYIDIRVGLSCDPHIDILLRDLLLMLLLVFVTSGCHNTTLYSILLSKLIVSILLILSLILLLKPIMFISITLPLSTASLRI